MIWGIILPLVTPPVSLRLIFTQIWRNRKTSKKCFWNKYMNCLWNDNNIIASTRLEMWIHKQPSNLFRISNLFLTFGDKKTINFPNPNGMYGREHTFLALILTNSERVGVGSVVGISEFQVCREQIPCMVRTLLLRNPLPRLPSHKKRNSKSERFYHNKIKLFIF